MNRINKITFILLFAISMFVVVSGEDIDGENSVTLDWGLLNQLALSQSDFRLNVVPSRVLRDLKEKHQAIVVIDVRIGEGSPITEEPLCVRVEPGAFHRVFSDVQKHLFELFEEDSDSNAEFLFDVLILKESEISIATNRDAVERLKQNLVIESGVVVILLPVRGF